MSRPRRGSANVADTLEHGAALLAEFLKFDLCGVVEQQPDGNVSIRIWQTAGNGPNGSAPSLVENRTVAGSKCRWAVLALAADQAGPSGKSAEALDADFEPLKKHDIRSTLFVPIRSTDQKVKATLVGFSRTVRNLSEEDLFFAEAAGHLTATSIARDQALASLQEEQLFAQTVMETLDSLVLVLSGEWKKSCS